MCIAKYENPYTVHADFGILPPCIYPFQNNYPLSSKVKHHLKTNQVN
jgi:hypothetical protein